MSVTADQRELQPSMPAARTSTTGTWERDPSIPARLRRVLALNDFEPAARKVLPKSIYGFVSGGSETNASLTANRAAFGDYAFRPRILRDVSKRTTTATLFGQSFAAPFGIAPMGGSGLCGLHADAAFARAAAKSNIPFILSASSIISLERIIKENPATWFQAYFVNDRDAIAAMTDRVRAAGYQTLVITVDVSTYGNREHNVRSGYSSPLRPTFRLALDSVMHPRWLIGTALRTVYDEGMPHQPNQQVGPGTPVISFAKRPPHLRDAISWNDVAAVRARWPGKLVLKGIMSAGDAKMARESGADGIIVSNHGGRQLDHTMATLHALPDVAAQAGTMTVMLDSGVRRGTDVLKAIALGAQFVFVGRPFIYAATIAGENGARHAIDLLSQEINRDLALLGCNSLADVTKDLLYATRS